MHKVAIIGAGPAGIAMGVELVQSGVSPQDIIICEKSEHDNASIRQFYHEGKDINSVYKNIEVPMEGLVGFTGIISLEQYHQMIDKLLDENHLNITYKLEVQKVTKEDNQFRIETSDGVLYAEYVILCSGVFSKPRKPDYPIPSPLLSRVSYDILKLQKDNIRDLSILVVGGGDSASEYVQVLADMKNKVTLSYRQDKIFRMNQLNVDRLMHLVDNNIVDMALGTNITSIEDKDGKILVKFQEREDLIVDKIVYSLGGASPSAFMANCCLDYDEQNFTLKEFNETDVDGLFMAGDLAFGRKGGSLMLAFNGARSIMQGLHQKHGFPSPKNI